MSKFFKKLLGFILLLTTIGLATCQALLKAEPNVITANSSLTQAIPSDE